MEASRIIPGSSGQQAFESLREELETMGYPNYQVNTAVDAGGNSLVAALALLDDGRYPAVGISTWKESWSEDQARPYYYDKEGQTTWDMPPAFRLNEWQMDADMFQISLPEARKLFEACEALWRNVPVTARAASLLLAKALGNICGAPWDEKFRRIRVQNESFKKKIWQVSGGREVLYAAGFELELDGSAVVMPPSDDTRLVRCAVARLEGLLDRRKEPEGGAGGQAGGLPFQKETHWCGVCNHPINDGSERVRTKKWDAPKGEYRYECMGCDAAETGGKGFNLCEGCWDKREGGDESVHTREHTFKVHHPITTQHNVGGWTQESDANPWGAFSGSVSGRSRERLRERHGI